MINKLVSEEQLLDEGFRKAVIQEIVGTENVSRKSCALKRYEVFRDQIKKWVIDSLAKEKLDADTVAQMENRARNISIAKKIVKNLAQSYVHGVTRKVESEEDTKTIEALAREMDFNTKMIKVDQYMQLFKNCTMQIFPQIDTAASSRAGKEKNRIAARVLAPYQYDVIEDINDHERMRAVILTDFTERDNSQLLSVLPSDDGRQAVSKTPKMHGGDRQEQIIADHPSDQGMDHRTFIWWSDQYHFTTDSKGAIIDKLSPEDFQNPIQMLPFVNFAEDQDGEFWAQGGDDVVDGCILVNKQITDMNAIAYHQGWGQGVITGKNVPKQFETGPHNWVILESTEEGESPPNMFFASASPPLGDWMRMVEQYVALLLSTNDLSPRHVSGKLDATDFPSGIAMLVEDSESTVDNTTRQTKFRDQEPIAWEATRKWQDTELEADALVDDFKEIGSFKDSDVKLKFRPPNPVISEKEKVEELKARKDLGIDTMIDLIMKDNVDMSREEAEQKAKEIQEEKLKKVAAFAKTSLGQAGQQPADESEGDGSDNGGEEGSV
jgi:hypothetical protein